MFKDIDEMEGEARLAKYNTLFVLMLPSFPTRLEETQDAGTFWRHTVQTTGRI